MNKVECIDFSCKELTQFTDSMLFVSGTRVADGTFKCDGRYYVVTLLVRGEVRVTYKDTLYRKATEFPAELTELIKTDKYWDLNDDVYVGNNNWFEYIDDEDGIVCERDLSKATPEDIKADMLEMAIQYFTRKKVC